MKNTGTEPVIEFSNGEVQVDASVIAEGLGLQPSAVQEGMRAGLITSLCECGVGEDEGRFRLTFYSEHRRFRLIVDKTGTILQRLKLDFGDRPLPPSARRAGS